MRKPLLSARVIIYSMMSIGFLSWMVWGHHMFVSGMIHFSSLLFSFPTLTITIPATIMTLIWLGSLYGAEHSNQLGIALCARIHLHVCLAAR